MAKNWGRIGTWALEAEKADAEQRERAAAADSSTARTTFFAGEPIGSFPSLNEAAATKPKKKNGVNAHSYGSDCREQIFDSKGLTTEEMILLPTGPRERTADAVDHSRRGGGFRSYGYVGDDPSRNVNRVSRADEVNNWTSGKKPFAMDRRWQDRSGFLSSSKADDVENWFSGKKSLTPLSRNHGFRCGFRDSFGSGMQSDRWGRGNVPVSRNGERETPRFVLDLPNGDSESKVEVAGSRPSPFAGARPREVMLAEKGLDWKKIEIEIEMNRAGGFTNSSSSRPSSAQSSRPESSGSQASSEGGAARRRPKVNPFGDAKPREVLLEEKGLDWRKIDQELEHRGIDRPETDEEMKLKEEIDHLKEELDKETEAIMTGDSSHHPTEKYDSLLGQIRKREKELENLTLELDDKVRFGQRAFTDARHGSASGRAPFSADKPSVQTGLSEDSRLTEFAERPRSRGTGDSWSKPMNEKRGFRSSRDSVFLTSRIMDRSRSRERW